MIDKNVAMATVVKFSK